MRELITPGYWYVIFHHPNLGGPYYLHAWPDKNDTLSYEVFPSAKHPHPGRLPYTTGQFVKESTWGEDEEAHPISPKEYFFQKLKTSHEES